MFQYATGFALAQKNDVVHKIDISEYDEININKKNTYRKFVLNTFKITSPIALSEEISSTKHPLGILSKINIFIKQKLFKKYYLDFHPKLLKKINKKIKAEKNFYLDG
jgi:hypothetical protein